MLIVTFIISVVALIISILAYQRTGGAKELKKTVDSLSSTMESLKDRTGDSLRDQIEKLTSVTESLRDRSANAIDRLESAIRGKEEEKAKEKKPPEEKPPTPRGPGKKGE